MRFSLLPSDRYCGGKVVSAAGKTLGQSQLKLRQAKLKQASTSSRLSRLSSSTKHIAREMKAPGARLVQIVDIEMENEISVVMSISIAVIISLFRHCDLDRSRPPPLCAPLLHSCRGQSSALGRILDYQTGDSTQNRYGTISETQRGMCSVIIIHDCHCLRNP